MPTEDYGRLAHNLKSQAEAQLETNATRAAAIAGLAQTSALLAINETLTEIADKLGTIVREVCRDPGYHDHG